MQHARSTLLALALPVVFASELAAQEYGVPRTMVSRERLIGRDLRVGDFDDDGDLDVVLAGLWGNGFHENDGHGVFATVSAGIPDASASVGVGDVNGDDHLDLVFGGFSEGDDRLAINDGTGHFSVSFLPPASNYTESVALLDVDGNGALDCLLGDFRGLELLRNDGAGNFTHDAPATPTLGGFGCVFDIEGADFDEDGHLDLFLAMGDDFERDRVLENDGLGNFTEVPNGLPPGPGQDSRAAVVADFDGDTRPDVAVGQWGLDWLFTGNGTLNFGPPANLPFTTGSLTLGLAAGDVNTDGYLDLVRAGSQGNEWLSNDGLGTFTAEGLGDLEWGSEGVALDDLDGDGDLDAFFTGSRNRLVLGDGAGSFGSAPGGMPDGGYLVDVAVGDANGDGRPDLFAAAQSGGVERRLYLSGPSGELTDASSSFGPSDHSPGSLAVGDLDGDLADDVIYGGLGCFAGEAGLFLNDGGGTFTDHSHELPTREARTTHVALADVDGNGTLDAHFSNTFGCTFLDSFNFLYLNDGSAGFTDGSAGLPQHEDSTNEAAFGDLDGDGDQDFVVANGKPTVSIGTEANRLYANDGSGLFQGVGGILAGTPRITVSVALGDVEGDGDLDVLFGNYALSGQTSAGNRLYLNQDGAGFVDGSAQLPAVENLTQRVRFFDQDLDGDLDVLETNVQQDHFWRNDGAGSFADSAGVLPQDGDVSTDVEVVDIDLDGDFDLALALQTHVLLDLSQQLARRQVPRLGQPLELDLFTDAGAPWLLFHSFGLFELELPPFGTLGLDPPTIALVASGVADGEGRAAVAFDLPADPNLAGAVVWWQSLMGAVPSFRNLERTELTGF